MSQNTGQTAQIDIPDEVAQVSSEAPQVDLRSGRHAMTITFSNNTGFDPNREDAIVVHLDSEWQPPTLAPTSAWGTAQSSTHRSNLPPRTFTFRLKNNEFFVAENFRDHSTASVRASLGDLKVVKFSSKNENYDETDDFTLILSFNKDDSRFDMRIQNNTPASRRVSEDMLKILYHDRSQMGRRIDHPDDLDDRPWAGVQDENKPLYQYPAVNWCRHVKIVVKKYKDPKYAGGNRFSPQVCQGILDQIDIQYSKTDPTHFYNLQSRAINAESEAAAEKLAELSKNKGTIDAQVIELPGYAERYALRFRNLEQTPWSVEGQNRGFLLTSPDTRFFSQFEAPYAKGQTDETKGAWQGVTFLKNKQVHISIENQLKNEHKAALATLAREAASGPDSGLIKGFWFRLVEDADESVTSRLRIANLHLLQLNQYQMEQKPKPATTGLPWDYHQHFPNVFLHGSSNRSSDRPINHNETMLQQAFENEQRFQLGERSHQELIRNVLAGTQGRYIGEGPPATGKTTAAAKLVCLLHECAKLEGSRRIVLSAHTNEAVRVACARILQVLKQNFFVTNEWDYVVLVVPQGVRNYWRMIGKQFDPRVEKAFLDAHLDRLAAKTPDDFTHFLRGQASMARYGYIQDMKREDIQKYEAQRQHLIGRLKDSARIWCATLSTIHHKDSIFGIQTRGGDKTLPGMNPHVLIIDEASQATDVSVAMAMLVTNPRNVVFTGDDKQLSPFTNTPEGERAWGKSMFGRLKARTDWTRLKKQYRTQKNLYAGTNEHYDREVQTDDSISNRETYHKILAAIKRISYQQSGSTNQVRLSNNIHVFDIANSKAETTYSGSSRNELEWQCMRGLMLALRAAGVPFDMMMALTAYQGQYDDMIANATSMKGVSFRKGDSAQGDEAEMVLFSMVRRNRPGFLTSIRRQNVVSSRAREAGFYFLDLSMIRNDPSMSASWEKWLNGVERANPAGLVHTVQGPVLWGVDGNQVNAQTAGASPLMTLPVQAARQPSPKPTSRGPSPAPARARAESTSSQVSQHRSRAGSVNDPNRGRATSVSTSQSRAGSIARELALRPRGGSISAPGPQTPPTEGGQFPLGSPSTQPRPQATQHGRALSTASSRGVRSPLQQSPAGIQSPLPRQGSLPVGLQGSSHATQQPPVQPSQTLPDQLQPPPNSGLVVTNAQQAKDRMAQLAAFGKANQNTAQRYNPPIAQYQKTATIEQEAAGTRYLTWLRARCGGFARQGQSPARTIEAVQAIAVIGEDMVLNLMRREMANAKATEARKEWDALKAKWDVENE